MFPTHSYTHKFVNEQSMLFSFHKFFRTQARDSQGCGDLLCHYCSAFLLLVYVAVQLSFTEDLCPGHFLRCRCSRSHLTLTTLYNTIYFSVLYMWKSKPWTFFFNSIKTQVLSYEVAEPRFTLFWFTALCVMYLSVWHGQSNWGFLLRYVGNVSGTSRLSRITLK